MKTKTLFGLGLLLVSASAQGQKSIVLTKAPVTVPAGKRWVIKANSKILVELDNSTMRGGNACNAYMLSRPGFLGAIYVGDYGRPEKGHTFILKDFEKAPFANQNTYSITAQAIVDNNFSFQELQSAKPNEVGKQVVEFWEGTSLYAGNCLIGIQLLEFPITQDDRIRESRKAENMAFETIKSIKTLQELYQKVGKENIVVKNYVGLEDNFRNGKEYIVYPNSSYEIAISFEKKYLRLYKENTPWKLPAGVRVGQSLEGLEMANGKEFDLFGFEWDYAGLVTNWNNGSLEGKVIATLTPTKDIDQSLYESITGQKEIRSSDEIVKSVEPVVTEIVIKR